MSINSPFELASELAEFPEDDILQPLKTSWVEQETWLISYVDLLLLMVTLFVLLLSYQQSDLSDQALGQELSVTTTASQVENVVLKSTATMSNQSFLDQIYVSDLKGRVNVIIDNDIVELVINDSILFLPGDATLSVTGGEVIDELALMLRDKNWHISVEGHTDDQPIATPRFPSNWELSSARASKVTRRLILRGVESTRLSAIGYADTRPVGKDGSVSDRAKNRRVSLVLSVPR